jgi:hypothetical protein
MAIQCELICLLSRISTNLRWIDALVFEAFLDTPASCSLGLC